MKCDKTETQIIHKNLVFSNITAIHFCVYNTETKVKTQTDCYSLRKAKHWDILKSHNGLMVLAQTKCRHFHKTNCSDEIARTETGPESNRKFVGQMLIV
jgi:hypothetical protein